MKSKKLKLEKERIINILPRYHERDYLQQFIYSLQERYTYIPSSCNLSFFLLYLCKRMDEMSSNKIKGYLLIYFCPCALDYKSDLCLNYIYFNETVI